MRVMGEANIDGAAPLAAGSIDAVVEMTAPWVAYDGRYGGASDEHDRIIIKRYDKDALRIGPTPGGAWTVQTFNVDAGRDTGMLAAHPELATPDFVAAGPVMKELPDYKGNRTVVFAGGSKVMLLQISSYYDSEAVVDKQKGRVIFQGADLSALLGPNRDGYRMFAEVMQGLKVHALPWTDAGPDMSKPGYTLEVTASIGVTATLRLTRRTLG